MQVDKESIYLIQKTIKKAGWIDLPAHGYSMFPFIRKGDICRFIVCEPSKLKKGDVVLFQSSKGQLVAHRFYQVASVNNEKRYLFKGDTNLGLDEPICSEQMIGKLDKIRRNRLTFRVRGVAAFVWGKLILSFPSLSGLLRKYVDRKNTLQF
jgi:signal peptidase